MRTLGQQPDSLHRIKIYEKQKKKSLRIIENGQLPRLRRVGVCTARVLTDLRGN